MFVIQTLISMCLISRLPLHRGPVTARLHIQRPELKLPKASALKHWINHPHFLHTTANHLRVRLTLPPLIIKMERSEVFFSCLAVLLALINGAPLMENYTANVTLSTLGHGSFIAEGERVPSQFFFLFFLRLVLTVLPETTKHGYKWLARIFLCYLAAAQTLLAF